jgi:putative ABC transport system permease protein
VAVISHALWTARFGGDPGVTGRQVTIDGLVYDVIGVMPPSFRFPANISVGGAAPPSIDLWIPMKPSEDLEDRGSHNYWAIARLKPGVSLAQARADVTAIADSLARLHPITNKNFSVTVQPLKAYVAGAARPALLALLGAVAFVLLLMCANIANLLLGRAESRRHEMAMRQALGASRGRLIRQSLTESLLLAGAGAILGLAVAYPGMHLLVRVAPPSIARLEETSLDWHVLAFMGVVTVAVGILFGLAPAIVGSGRAVPQRLKDGVRVSGSPAGRRIRQSLVLAQLALAVVLLVGAGLLLRSFAKVAAVDIGIEPTNVLTGIMALSPARYGDAARQADFIDRVLQRVQALRGVAAAAVSQTVPLTGINDQGGIAIEGRPDPPPGVSGPHANRPHVSPAYFDAMGIRLLDGRLFDARDDADGEPVAIVSDLAARTYWPGANPIGKRVAVDWTDAGPAWRRIVGIVQGTRHFGVEAPQKPEVYVPFAQAPSPFVTLIVRTQGAPAGMIEAIKNEIAATDPEQAASWFRPLDDLVSASTARRRFQTALVSVFAALALLLAAIGVYGVMGHMVAQRRREIGVRLALGAKPSDVVAMVLRGGVWLTIAGIAAGVAGAVALSKVLAGFVFGVSPLDPATYAGVIVVLGFVAGLSVYRPSRRAASVDPVVVLRDE